MFDTTIPVYSVMIFSSLAANIIIVAILSKKHSFSKNEIVCLLLYESVGIIGGAKILTFIQNYRELDGQFDFLALGFTAYGAVIGALLFLILFCLQFRKPIDEMLYIFTPSIPLMYGVGKIGCFLAGCCFGIEYSGFGSIVYEYSGSASANTNRFPVQIVETIVFLGIFAYMMIKHKKNQFDMKKVGISFILCGFAKFALDFLRDSNTGQVLSQNQLISIVFIIIGIGIVSIQMRPQK